MEGEVSFKLVDESRSSAHRENDSRLVVRAHLNKKMNKPLKNSHFIFLVSFYCLIKN